MANLILHCGAKTVTRADLAAVVLPPATRSYKPVAYLKAIDFVQEAIADQLALPVLGETFGLNKAGDQMFAEIRVDTGSNEHALSFGLRQSLNKAFALGFCAGVGIMVCDNLCFSGDAFTVMRKNTTNVWENFTEIVWRKVADSLGHYKSMANDIDRLKATPCSRRRAHAYLGVMRGEGLLSATQATVAHGDVNVDRHDAFNVDTLWRPYNAVTEALKKSTPENLIGNTTAAHGFFMNQVAA